MDPTKEGFHERSFGSSLSGQSTSTSELNKDMSQLRRSFEHLEASKTRTHATSSLSTTFRSRHVQEQAELFKRESERPRTSIYSQRTFQDASTSSPISQANLHDLSNEYQHLVPAPHENISSQTRYAEEESRAEKHVTESSLAVRSTSSRAFRSTSLPKPSAPPGAFTRSLEHSSSIQVTGYASLIKQDRNLLPDLPSMRSRTTNSVRSHTAMMKAAEGKSELEIPKASEAEIHASILGTRQAFDALERAIWENEKLKLSHAQESERVKQRLAYFEQNYEAASKARMDEIKKMIIKSQELDLAFLVDATGSMQPSIDMIKTTVISMAEGIMQSYPDCKLRVAFVPYRDYENVAQDDGEMCDFTTSFSGPGSEFVQALSRVRAAWGADDAEDVFTGIARVAQLRWVSPNRVLFHIADAPCHGRRFHDGVGDFYPDGDKFGRRIEDQLQLLYKVCGISTYFFCHLNSSTEKMIRSFREAAGSSLIILEEKFNNICNIPHKVITLCRGTIQKSLSVNVQNPFLDIRFVPEDVIKGVPCWAQVPEQSGVYFKCKWYLSLDEMLNRIRHKMALDEEAMHHVQVRIAKHPFSDEGAVRWPYHALITCPNESPQSMVVKRFKTPLGKDVREVHKRERYWAQMEVQSVSAQMAKEFNKRTSNMRNVKRVEFTEVTTLEVCSGPNTKFYNMESLLEGAWLRYSNNGGYVNTLDYAAVLQAFTHWTYEVSRNLLMVTDLQGVRMKNSSGENVFCLCDPAIHCTDVLRFTRTNLGTEGFRLFFETHKCNDVCEKLGLRVGTAGRTRSGTIVGSYF